MLRTIRSWLCGDEISIEHSGIQMSQNLEFTNNGSEEGTFELPRGRTHEP